MTPWVDILTLTQPKGVKGRLGARRAPGLFVSLEGLEIACVPPPLDRSRYHRILRCAEAGDELWVELSDVESRDEARELVDCHGLARKSDLARRDAFFDEPKEMPDWTSWTVIDETCGFRGVVREVAPRPQQPLLIVEAEGGGEVMIPFAEELIVSVDDEVRRIFVALPHGLIEL